MDRCNASQIITFNQMAAMPLTFCKYFGTKVAVFIDCFEDFINKPSNYMARAGTWSQYKHQNTILAHKEWYHLYQKFREVE